MKLTVENLPGDEQENMVKHMNKAMEGTFFEKWLSMGGWYKVRRKMKTASGLDINTYTASASPPVPPGYFGHF